VRRIEVEAQGGRGTQVRLAKIPVNHGNLSAGGMGQAQDIAAKGALAAIRAPQNQNDPIGGQSGGGGSFPAGWEIDGNQGQHKGFLKTGILIQSRSEIPSGPDVQV
jgi:hypothetical protein